MSETLTPATLAAQLHGRDRRIGIAHTEDAQAKAHGLVIAYGASDDTLVFGGAIENEVAAWGGAVVPVGPSGVGDTGPSRFVEALWDEDADTVWTILTSIPHAEFVLMDEGEPWCRGIVFRLADTGAAESPKPAPPRDWQMLSQWLDAQWQENRRVYGLTLHTGIFEGHAACASVLAALPVEMSAAEKLDRLHTFLHETLQRTESPEEDQD